MSYFQSHLLYFAAFHMLDMSAMSDFVLPVLSIIYMLMDIFNRYIPIYYFLYSATFGSLFRIFFSTFRISVPISCELFWSCNLTLFFNMSELEFYVYSEIFNYSTEIKMMLISFWIVHYLCLLFMKINLTV